MTRRELYARQAEHLRSFDPKTEEVVPGVTRRKWRLGTQSKRLSVSGNCSHRRREMTPKRLQLNLRI